MGKLYDIFARSSNKNDKGLKKEDIKIDPGYGLGFFFRLAFRNIGKIAKINLLFILLSFPFILMLAGFSGMFSEYYRIPQSQMYPIISGVAEYKQGPVIDALYGIYGVTSYTPADTFGSLALKWGGGFLWLFTFGFANVGMTYILRGIVRGQNLFIWSDFFGAIKKNIKQGFFMGVIDLVLVFVLVFDIISYNANANNFLYNLFFFMTIAIMAICALFIILVVMFQPGNSSGIGALGGTTETFLGKNKSKTFEHKMKVLTVISGIFFAVLAVAFAIIMHFVP